MATLLLLLLIVLLISEYALVPLSSQEQSQEVQHTLLLQDQMGFIQSALLKSAPRSGTPLGGVEPLTLGSNGVPPFGAPSPSTLSIDPSGTGLTISVPTSAPQPNWNTGNMCNPPTGSLVSGSGGVTNCTFYGGGGSGPTFESVGSNLAVNYIPVTLTNNQAAWTPVGFQQMVTVNPNSIGSSHFAAGLSNVNWQDGNGHILPSWLESGITSTSPSTVYWVNLGANTVPGGGGTLTIYMVIYAPAVQAIDGTDTGAEPAYTGTYGQYDNGASVFPLYYDNFAGTIIKAEYALVQPLGSTVTQNNGLTVTMTTANYAGIALTAGLPSSPAIVFDANVTLANPATGSNAKAVGVALQTGSGITGASAGYWYERAWSTGLYIGAFAANVGSAAGTTHLLAVGVEGIAWPATGTVTTYDAYAANTFSTSTETLSGTVYPCYGGATVSSASSIAYQWGRARLYPPNGVMPVTSIGSLTAAVNVPQIAHGVWNESASHATWTFELPTDSFIQTESINWTGNWDNITIYQGASNLNGFNLTLLGNHDNVYLCYGGVTICSPGSTAVGLNDHQQIFDIYGQYDTWQLGAGPGLGAAASAGGHDFMNVFFSGENVSQAKTACPNGTVAPPVSTDPAADQVLGITQANNPTGNVLNITYYDDTGHTSLPQTCPPLTCVNEPLTTWTNISSSPATEAGCAWEDGLLAGPWYSLYTGQGALDVYVQNRYTAPEMIALEGGAVIGDVAGQPSVLLDPPLFTFQGNSGETSGTITLVTFEGNVANDQGYTTAGVETFVVRNNVFYLAYGDRLGDRYIGSPDLTISTQYPAAWLAYLSTISSYTSGPVNCTHAGAPYSAPYTCLAPPDRLGRQPIGGHEPADVHDPVLGRPDRGQLALGPRGIRSAVGSAPGGRSTEGPCEPTRWGRSVAPRPHGPDPPSTARDAALDPAPTLARPHIFIMGPR